MKLKRAAYMYIAAIAALYKYHLIFLVIFSVPHLDASLALYATSPLLATPTAKSGAAA